MNVFVVGRTHLGNVTAECVKKFEHDVVQYDEGDAPPLDAAKADVVWIAIDTPIVDGVADYEEVLGRAHLPLIHAKPGALVLVSSQVPVGTADAMAAKYTLLNIVSQPENIRTTGTGVEDFLSQPRMVVGIDPDLRWHFQERLGELLGSFTPEILWMSRRSAEMVKHALNAALATQIALANELGRFCMGVGAHYPDVLRALKADPRIGPKAYMAYGGGPGAHLMREINFLHGKAGGLFSAVKASHEGFRPVGGE